MGAFNYPETSYTRRHGPHGYANYASYRPWLRDEFTFRCVYCLVREEWGRESGDFDLDHFQCQAKNAELGLDYDNLLYSCRRCNTAKGAQDVPDPCTVLTSDQVRVLPDGKIEGLSPDARKLIRKLCLDSDRASFVRRTWIRIIELAEKYDPDLYRRLMRFPEDLPDLSRLRPPGGNSRPDGIKQSFLCRRNVGDLLDTY